MVATRPELTPSAWIGVSFDGDPGVIHERMLESPIEPPAKRCWIVLTLDGHEYV